MKIIVFFYLFMCCIENPYGITNIKNYNIKGVYKIFNSLNNKLYLGINNNGDILFLNKNSYFRLIEIKSNSNNYLIESKNKNKLLGIDEKGNIILYNNIEVKEKIIWTIIKIKKNYFLIKNMYNNKYLEVNNDRLQCLHEINILNKDKDTIKKINKRFLFRLLKLYEDINLTNLHIKYINKENIDILIKYIDLTDKKLNREGITQIYKDFDNKELKYSLRSILENIPWIRKIFILMPNEKVKYLKSYEEINEKIIYINDRDFLGFDSANIFSFTFNLYKLKNFGVSRNFIYIEDDFFIGKHLKKSDFFYYDIHEKKISPFLLTMFFNELNKTRIINNYYNLYKQKDSIHPHSNIGWWFSIYSTDKYFFEKYNNLNLINTNFTHNAISKNLDNLREIYEEIKDYDYFNETIYSKERHILTLNQPHFFNLYQLNINHKKVRTINYKYVEIEKIKKYNFKDPLFVLNTGGNHIPLNRQNKIQQKVMNKRFFIYTKYEIINEKNKDFIIIKNILVKAINIFIIMFLTKIIIIFEVYFFK